MARKPHWELHSHRRAQLLRQHPRIRQLFGHDARTQLYAYACIALQLLLAYFSRASLLTALALGVSLGPYVDAALLCFLHEATHMLVFRRARWNRLIAIAANLPLLLPISEVHRQHHARHHASLGDAQHDVDVPCGWEVRLIANKRAAKALWLMLNMLVLPARSLCRLPIVADVYLVVNWLSCLVFTLTIAHYSRTSLLFLIVSLLNAQGLHPANARQIQRHVFDGSERMRVSGEHAPATYSYYGPLNALMLNVGYHVEHHDFPRIPCTRLPQLRALAGEQWYPSARAHRSRGVRDVLNFVCNERISLADFAR